MTEPTLRDTVRWIIDKIEEFERLTAENEITDAGDTWFLLNLFRDEATASLAVHDAANEVMAAAEVVLSLAQEDLK